MYNKYWYEKYWGYNFLNNKYWFITGIIEKFEIIKNFVVYITRRILFNAEH